ncbi:hypothetical protein E1258_26855 [Micromonospora sp. KC207]|nr:hypothetical protein E1258_26855 [Micromonospora sp. KC207]
MPASGPGTRGSSRPLWSCPGCAPRGGRHSGSPTDDAATDDAATDGAATDGAATDGAATDGAATDGASLPVAQTGQLHRGRDRCPRCPTRPGNTPGPATHPVWAALRRPRPGGTGR